MAVKWHFIDPQTVNKYVFGLDVVFAVKVKRHINGDVRGFYHRGWECFADFVEYSPISGKKLKQSQWYIFCAKGIPW